MPAWTRPSDIRFDHGAADAAIAAVATLRFELEALWIDEEVAAAEALGGWEGLAAEAFTASLRARERRTAHIADALARLQVQLEAAVDDAHAAQARVDWLQDAWEAEARAEAVAAAASAQEVRIGGAATDGADG